MNRPTEVFLVFLRLGCIAFGGPVAHLGYYHDAFIKQRKWIDEASYADLVALCQFLPGPTSSQVGFAIGYRRAGVLGAFLAWAGFTLPSAVLMIGFGLGMSSMGILDAAGWIIGLKLVAVVVVAHALLTLYTKLCPDRSTALIAAAAAAVLVVVAHPLMQIGVILGGFAVGCFLFDEKAEPASEPVGLNAERLPGRALLVAFFAGLLAFVVLAALFPGSLFAVADAFYRAGSMVFGGGHVVLPLLERYTVGAGWVDAETFLAGYGATQAMPGPLFTFTAFLGSVINLGPRGSVGGLFALVMVYVPSWLMVLGLLPYWDRLRRMDWIRSGLKGTNAVVVGLLFAAFCSPIIAEGIEADSGRLAFTVMAFALLKYAKLPVWALVIGCAVVGAWVF